VRVALDVRFRVESGASTYIRALVPRLFEAAPDAEFLYVRYAGQALDDLPAAPTIDAPAGSGLRDLAWTNRFLPRALRARGADLYHGLKLYGPLRTEVPMVHTVHSITRPRDGEFPMSLAQRAIHAYGNAASKRSRKVIGVSSYVSDFLVEEIGVPRERVRTVHLGVADAFRDALARADRPAFDAPGLGDTPYVVCVGNIEYVKNHASVVRALARIRDRVPHHLVIAGRADKPAAAELRRLIEAENLAHRVHLVGFLDLPTLVSCLHRAEVQVHPSLSEGFCLAVLEGMCAGLPIVGSAIPGLVEALGDCGRFVEDPLDDRALAEALLGWLHDPEDAKRSAERGRLRSEAFTWESAAKRTLAVYEECFGTERVPMFCPAGGARSDVEREPARRNGDVSTTRTRAKSLAVLAPFRHLR
jgi:L-malate glycosyltransferase